MSICMRSTSFWSCAAAVGLMTDAPASSFCCAPWSALFFSFSSATFCWLSADTLAVDTLPSADSVAIRWMLTKAYFVPVGNGRWTCGAGACAAGAGAAGV
ncbi:MAG: hypothetical protein A3F70_15190 [Acidobacteria bacterium RIFCSPLOWO2_12_FULL_67_14]|nr:MAG: hypothetical protein A3F70_15190 [Acidobacteria bacterium RIFCSPLOWO2_12_FULL_67_14]